MRYAVVYLIVFSSSVVFGQDTIRMMQYNLLNYGNYFSNCTSTNNNVDDKNELLRIIIDYVKPDIFAVNEISDESYYHNLLLTDALNTNGINFYAKVNLPNLSYSPIMNQVYYNTQKLFLVNNVALETNYRDIDIVKFSLDDPASGEEIFLHCAVAHLKAGTGWEDERGYEVNQLMNYLNNGSASGNYTFSGDFNVYTASEPAIQNALFYPNTNIRFYDPVDQLGAWNNNAYYAGVHTQSTHTSSSCAAGGGMDDRFDFILISDEIRDGTDKIKKLEGSYKALGQDGLHFNQSILSAPTNSTIPGNVLNALYGVSDHLPVILDLLVGDHTGITDQESTLFDIYFNNPADEYLTIKINSGLDAGFTAEIINMYGQTFIYQEVSGDGARSKTINTRNLTAGAYFLKITDISGRAQTYKFLIK
ncbi:MAG: T9SS type A sorting domain-containing protein [Bacteroidales bacterium]|nr:T9SS type A sorting domain-containing protein [Bacteroidales bacterium]MCF8403041.1 T9SS type A sorting domain-containing protein [Bacteroidales bacterium]